MVVYLDIILLLNFAIDTLLLWFTAFFRKERVIWWRMFISAAFGSTYIAFFFFPSFAGLYQWAVKLLFSILMLLIAFGYTRIFALIQNLCIFYFVAFVFGGGVFGLEYMMSSRSEVVNGILLTHNDSFGVGTKPTFLVVLVGFILIFFLSKRSYQAIQEPRKLEALLVEVKLTLAGESVICRGLVDTGNQLHEPITRIPVMVVESSLLAHILPSSLNAHVVSDVSKLDGLDELLAGLPDGWHSRIRLVPYRSVSRGMDFMVALKPDVVVVTSNGQRYETTRVLIGLNPIPLSSDRKYQAIVHPAILQELEDPSFVHPTSSIN